MKLAEDFQVTLANKSDEHLCGMIARAEDYLPEAIELARAELSRRALSPDRLAQLQTASESRRQTELERAEQPLGILVKVLIVITGMIPTILFAYRYAIQGFSRKADEVWKWLVIRYLVLGFLAFWYALIKD